MRVILPGNSKWQENPSLLNALGLDGMKPPVVSVVGAGGKTSTIEYLAEEYRILNRKAIVTTTTHMYRPSGWNWCREDNIRAVEDALKTGSVLWIGLPFGEDKISSPALPLLNYLREKGIPLLVEADGARRLPFKVPGEKEPVVLPYSNMVIGILGMDALGRPIREVSFRPSLTAEYLKKSEDALITEEDYAKVITGRHGLRKNVAGDMEYAVILNKTDDDKRQKGAAAIRSMLKEQGIQKVYLTSHI